MANKRMFNLNLIDTDLFLEMPISSQNLYFHLGMRADDEGFVGNPKKIIRTIGANDDDLRVLITKKFVIPFETGVIVIRHWKLNNYLRNDRKQDTIYQYEKSLLVENNSVYELGIPNDNQMSTNCPPRIDKNSIDKDNICPSSDGQENPSFEGKEKDNLSEEEQLSENFNLIWKDYPRKDNKNTAYKHYKSWLKGKSYVGRTEKLENKDMWYAVQIYRYELMEEKKEKQFIKMGSTFFNEAIFEYATKYKEDTTYWEKKIDDWRENK